MCETVVHIDVRGSCSLTLDEAKATAGYLTASPHDVQSESSAHKVSLLD